MIPLTFGSACIVYNVYKNFFLKVCIRIGSYPECSVESSRGFHRYQVGNWADFVLNGLSATSEIRADGSHCWVDYDWRTKLSGIGGRERGANHQNSSP
jgi:hypothetical protein